MATGCPTGGARAGQRRPFTRADYHFLAQHYRDTPAPVLAQQLGRMPGSLYDFIRKYPSCANRVKANSKLPAESPALAQLCNVFIAQRRNPCPSRVGLFRALAARFITAAAIRTANLDKRNGKIRDAFYKRYTQVPRAQKPDRERVVAQLAEEYYLSAKRVEAILWVSSK